MWFAGLLIGIILSVDIACDSAWIEVSRSGYTCVAFGLMTSVVISISSCLRLRWSRTLCACVGFIRTFLPAYCLGTIYQSAVDGAWLVGIAGLFSSVLLLPLDYWFIRRTLLHGKAHCAAVFAHASLVLSVCYFDFFVISPFFATLLST